MRARQRGASLGAAVVCAALVSASAGPAAAQPKRCKGTKRWYAGQCRYPDEIEQLKKASGTAPEVAPEPGPRPPREPVRDKGEAAACALARRLDDSRAWTVYLEQHSDGICAPEAKMRLEVLAGVAKKQPVAKPAPPLPPPPPPPPPPRSYIERVSPLAWLGFGVGATGLGMWAVTGIVASSKASEVKDACPDGICPQEQQQALGEATALAHVTTASFVVGMVGAAGGVAALLLLTDEETPAPADGHVQWQPWVGFGHAGVRGLF
jgi:hypothetical protein